MVCILLKDEDDNNVEIIYYGAMFSSLDLYHEFSDEVILMFVLSFLTCV